jgi:uncharacterized protein YndB with AHSA1/START domain
VTTNPTILTPADRPDIEWSRELAAPPTVLFELWTRPENLRRWWGPRILEMVVCEVDLRVGGAWRFVHRLPDGQELGFHGVYQAIEAPDRLSSTFVEDADPQHELVETTTFVATPAGSLVTGRMVHDSIATRDAHIAAGMEQGLTESLERVDELLGELARG